MLFNLVIRQFDWNHAILFNLMSLSVQCMSSHAYRSPKNTMHISINHGRICAVVVRADKAISFEQGEDCYII